MGVGEKHVLFQSSQSVVVSRGSCSTLNYMLILMSLFLGRLAVCLVRNYRKFGLHEDY